MGATVEAIEAALARLPDLPAKVSSWQVETGPDATDDPAAWVWVVLEDEDVDFQTCERLREMVHDRVLHETDDGSWVYVRFRTASELSLADKESSAAESLLQAGFARVSLTRVSGLSGRLLGAGLGQTLGVADRACRIERYWDPQSAGRPDPGVARSDPVGTALGCGQPPPRTNTTRP